MPHGFAAINASRRPDRAAYFKPGLYDRNDHPNPNPDLLVVEPVGPSQDKIDNLSEHLNSVFGQARLNGRLQFIEQQALRIRHSQQSFWMNLGLRRRVPYLSCRGDGV
jgi:hypothetical protein